MPAAPEHVDESGESSGLELKDEVKIEPGSDAIAIPDAAALNVARLPAEGPPVTGAVSIPDSETVAHDPDRWRPLLSLFMAALGVPLAYWSRSMISLRALKRASLPGPRRPARSLPGGSGD